MGFVFAPVVSPKDMQSLLFKTPKAKLLPFYVSLRTVNLNKEYTFLLDQIFTHADY